MMIIGSRANLHEAYAYLRLRCWSDSSCDGCRVGARSAILVRNWPRPAAPETGAVPGVRWDEEEKFAASRRDMEARRKENAPMSLQWMKVRRNEIREGGKYACASKPYHCYTYVCVVRRLVYCYCSFQLCCRCLRTPQHRQPRFSSTSSPWLRLGKSTVFGQLRIALLLNDWHTAIAFSLTPDVLGIDVYSRC